MNRTDCKPFTSIRIRGLVEGENPNLWLDAWKRILKSSFWSVLISAKHCFRLSRQYTFQGKQIRFRLPFRFECVFKPVNACPFETLLATSSPVFMAEPVDNRRMDLNQPLRLFDRVYHSCQNSFIIFKINTLLNLQFLPFKVSFIS